MMDELEHERNEVLNALMGSPTDPQLEPGRPIHVKDILHQGDENYPAPIVEQTFASAGYVVLYDTKTRVPSITNRNMLPAQLKKKHEDGTLMYTTVKPSEPPAQGRFKCLLHKDDENRKLYDEWGFAVCKKDKLPTPHQVTSHMEHRHPVEWKTIERERQRLREEEDRKFQREWMAAVSKTAGAAEPETAKRGRPAKEPVTAA